MIRPGKRLGRILSGFLLLAVLACVWPAALVAWKWSGAALLVVAVLDALLASRMPKPVLTRRLPGRFAQGIPGEVELRILNRSGRGITLDVFDGIPSGARTDQMPWSGMIAAGTEARVIYQVALPDRGEVGFSQAETLDRSPLGLWLRKTRHLGAETVRVYPNYEPVIRYSLLALQHRESPLGVQRRPRSGSSRDFHQLRDYRDGDPLSQIDWKATSRRQFLISREFREQRDQSIVFLVDTGRRMRALEDGVPQFDRVLNAILLVAHVALKQGDQVAVKSFGGSDTWLPPVKGSHAMPVLLNHLYKLQTTTEPSDFTDGVEKLMARQRRRSLVILLTNLRGEDESELPRALKVLERKHLVLLASMREGDVASLLTNPVQGFHHALQYLAADGYAREREAVLATLRGFGVLTLDCSADEFPVALANRYLDLKAMGRI
jgi:uncharacterized protein (DUF58 family)